MNKNEHFPEVPAVGDNLKRERRKQHLTLDALALASGVSKAMLSQIEANKVNPTIGTLWKVVKALNIDFDAVLSGEHSQNKKFDITRAENITSLKTGQSNAVFRVLSPLSMADFLELHLVTLPPGCIHASHPHTSGTEEYLTILSGSVTVIAGENQAHLNTGDVIAFQADVDHVLKNESASPAELYMVIRFPGA